MSPILRPHSEITHGFSSVTEGNMDFRFGPHDQVIADRSKFLHGLGLSTDDCVQQFGMGDTVQVVTRANRGKGMRSTEDRLEANALITNEPGVGLFLCIADCLPIIFFDPVHRVIALAHAARASTNHHIAIKVTTRMASEFGSKPANLLIAFGPAVRAESYIFDHHIYELVSAEWQPFLHELAPDKIAVDNIGFNRAQLLVAGVPAANIADSGIDSGSNPGYFSHVRALKTGQPEGRLAAAIALR